MTTHSLDSLILSFSKSSVVSSKTLGHVSTPIGLTLYSSVHQSPVAILRFLVSIYHPGPYFLKAEGSERLTSPNIRSTKPNHPTREMNMSESIIAIPESSNGDPVFACSKLAERHSSRLRCYSAYLVICFRIVNDENWTGEIRDLEDGSRF